MTWTNWKNCTNAL